MNIDFLEVGNTVLCCAIDLGLCSKQSPISSKWNGSIQVLILAIIIFYKVYLR